MSFPLVRLDSLYQIARGGSPRPIKDFITDDPNGINWIKIGDATASGKYIYETKQKIIPEGIQRSRLVKKGDFVLSNSMSFGRPYIMGISGCIHDGWLVLSAKDKSIDQDFLYYILGSPFVFKQFDSLAAGSTVRNLNIDLVSGVKIPLLPINEQKRIVAMLDQAFAEIEKTRANAEQNLKNARELFESYLQQVFSQRGDGWSTSELFDHIQFIDYRGKTPTKTDFGLRLITAKNVRMGYLKPNPAEFVAPESYDAWMTRGIPQKGDVLFTTEAPLANVAQLDTDKKVVFAQRIITMQPDPLVINNTFLKYMLMSSPIQQLIHDKGTGATCTGIKASLLKKIPISYPSKIAEQEEYVLKLDKLDDSVKELEKIYQQKIDSLDELKKSILQKAFSGKLSKEITI